MKIKIFSEDNHKRRPVSLTVSLIRKPFVHIVVFTLGFSFGSLQAATIAVDSTSDTPGGADCNLRDAIGAATSDTAVAGCTAGSGADTIDLSAIVGGTITLTSGVLQLLNNTISADSGVTIEGGGVTIDANSLHQVMDIQFNNVTLENLHLVKGKQEFDEPFGGCLYIKLSDVTIRGSTVTNCEADQGAGIYATGSVLNISDTTISGNTAQFGGGLRLISSTVSMSNSRVAGNHASTEGGGLMIDRKSLTLSSTTLDSNSAQFGGGMSMHGSIVSLVHSTLSGNQATGQGGGAWVVGGNTSMTDTTLSNNTAPKGGGLSQVNGGVVNISASLVQQNIATGSGGGFSFKDGEHSITNSTVSGNEAGEKGGAIYSEAVTLSITDSTLLGNTADVQGGGLFQNAGDVTVSDSRIEENNSPGSGGGIFVKGGQHRISNSTLAGNVSGGNGGAVFAMSTLSLSGSTLSGNSAAVRGGGLYAWKNTTHSITNSTFSDNYAELGAGALAVDEATVSVHNSTITGSSSGGAASLWITGGGNFKSVNSILYNPADLADCEINPGFGIFVGAGVNFISQIGNCVFASGIVIDGDPMLGPLGDNGGPTLTHLPLAGSPVINKGSNAEVPVGLTRDQRGPLYLRIDGGTVELGSVEITSALPQVIFADSLE